MSRQRSINQFGTPTQQSMTLDPNDHVGLNITKPVLGVILEVFPADNSQNRSSFQREDRRGYLHTATVLVVNSGRGSYFTLDNVIITPDAVSGLDDYYERLPRPCTSTITGQPFNSQLNHINPYDLDGDWCIVSFLGGSVDQPFVLRWWPHPWNSYDAATSGQLNPNNTSQPRTLQQAGRYFHRINGVEFTVTKTGNLYISTHRANSTLNYGTPVSPIEGRFPRTLSDSIAIGGSVKAWIKSDQSLEIDFDEPLDGLGVEDVIDPELPQTNPSSQTTSDGTHTNTYCKYTKDALLVQVPDELNLKSKRRLLLSSDEDTRLTVGNDLRIDVSGNTVISSTGPVSVTAQQTLDVTAQQITAQADVVAVTGATTLTLTGASISLSAVEGGASPGTVLVDTTGVILGDGALGGVVGGIPLAAAFAAFQATVAVAESEATFDTTAWATLSAAVLALSQVLATAGSETTLVG